jgi:hypothetical protein
VGQSRAPSVAFATGLPILDIPARNCNHGGAFILLVGSCKLIESRNSVANQDIPSFRVRSCGMLKTIDGSGALALRFRVG